MTPPPPDPETRPRTSQAAVGDPEHHLELYRRMLVIRRVEDLVQALFLRGEVYGTTHLYSGQVFDAADHEHPPVELELVLGLAGGRVGRTGPSLWVGWWCHAWAAT